jgi:ribosomal protein S18 acetylase RimI-like enzyme
MFKNVIKSVLLVVTMWCGYGFCSNTIISTLDFVTDQGESCLASYSNGYFLRFDEYENNIVAQALHDGLKAFDAGKKIQDRYIYQMIDIKNELDQVVAQAEIKVSYPDDQMLQPWKSVVNWVTVNQDSTHAFSPSVIVNQVSNYVKSLGCPLLESYVSERYNDVQYILKSNGFDVVAHIPAESLLCGLSHVVMSKYIDCSSQDINDGYTVAPSQDYCDFDLVWQDDRFVKGSNVVSTQGFAISMATQKDFLFDSIDPSKIIAGLFGYKTEYKHTGKRCHVLLAWVDEKYRKQGLGTTMMNLLIDDCAADCTVITLDTFEWQAKEFYENFGFKVVATEKSPAHRPGITKYYMEKNLIKEARNGY